MPGPRRKPMSFLTGRERLLMGLGLAQFFAVILVFLGAFAWGGSMTDTVMRVLIVVFFSCFLTFVIYFRDHLRSRSRLVDREFRVCIYCGYDLRATERPAACPECGETIDTFAMRSHWEQRYPEYTWQKV